MSQPDMFGQRPARARRGGVWVEVDANGYAVESDDTDAEPEDLDPETETLAVTEPEPEPEPEPQPEPAPEPEPEPEVQDPGLGQEAVDYSKMSRAELNEYAASIGLNPADYKNRNLLVDALP